MSDVDPIHVAAMDLLRSLSPSNLAKGDTFAMTIPRRIINQLRDEVEARYPGALAQLQESDRQSRRGA